MATYFSNIPEKEIEAFHALIAKNVKRLRLEKNRTILDLSYDLGFRSGSFLSSAEACKNKKHFSLEHLYKLSKAFDVPVTEFFKEEKAE